MEWKLLTKKITDQLDYYKRLSTDPRTPKISKWLIVIAIAYLISPIDIIPNFIPILGQLDDLIIVPGLIYVATSLIPENVKRDVRIKCISI